jgi:hypothetical protein
MVSLDSALLNGIPEFLHIILTFVALHQGRCGESQLSMLNNKGSAESPPEATGELIKKANIS